MNEHASPDLFDFAARAVRNSDPDTSRDAAVARLAGKATDRRAALSAHCAAGERGLTDFELAARIGRQQTSAGKRRGELRDIGLVEDSGERRPAPSGSNAIVWRITSKGRDIFKIIGGQSCDDRRASGRGPQDTRTNPATASGRPA